MRAIIMCALLPDNPPEGITPELESRLRSRKKTNPTDTEEDRWSEIYKLLFPGEAVPSPRNLAPSPLHPPPQPF